MAKAVPAELLTTSDGSFGVKTRPEGSSAAISTTFSSAGSHVIIRTRPIQGKAASEAQRNQRREYSECDCLWKNREPEQVEAWNRYIGLTKIRAKKIQDSYRLFMSRCLMWDFLEFFEEHLYSIWVVDTIQDSTAEVTINFHMGSLFDGPVPLPTWEPETILTRII